MSRILVIEDETHVSAFLVRGLSALGYSVSATGRLDEALERIDGGGHELVILDLRLPDGDGFAVLERIRVAGRRIPVIVLTGSRVSGRAESCLDGGADDYVRKPFELAELAARIRARLRPPGVAGPRVVQVGDVRLDLRTRRACNAGRRADLTTRELVLLETLLSHADEVLASTCSRPPGAMTSTRARISSRSTSPRCGASSATT